MDRLDLEERRRTRWRQRPELKVATPEDAVPFIDQMGICTLYPACSEVPNLMHAYVGDPDYKAEAKWDSPSGQIYPWRWILGARQAAYYGVLVGKKPTFVSWRLLPQVLGAFKERRHPEELFALGELSENAMRVARALEEAGRPLATDALRSAAGFPIGKENRNAYLKALEELELKVLVAKRFETEDAMLHALVDLEYREAADQAHELDPEEALVAVLTKIVHASGFVELKPLARGFRVAEVRMEQALKRVEGVKEVAIEKSRLFVSQE